MLVALGIMLVIVGAIVTFAIDAAVDGVDLQAIGWIIMGGGALALIAAAIQGAGWLSMSNRQMHSERHVSSDGNHVVEDTKVS